jgi:Leucine Rich repeat
MMIKRFRTFGQMPLATFFCVFLCGIVFFGCIAWQFWIVQHEDQILRDMGVRDFEDGRSAASAYPGLLASIARDYLFPEWTASFIQEPFCGLTGRVAYINFSNERDGPFDLRQIAELSHLKELRFPERLVDDEICQQLGSLSALEELDLSGNPVGDQGVRHLAGLSKLRRLFLENTLVTDESVRALCLLPRLEWLVVSYTDVSDRSMDELVKLRSLKWLSLRGCRISDEGLPKLNALPVIENVNVKDTEVTEKGVFELERRKGTLSVDWR